MCAQTMMTVQVTLAKNVRACSAEHRRYVDFFCIQSLGCSGRSRAEVRGVHQVDRETLHASEGMGVGEHTPFAVGGGFGGPPPRIYLKSNLTFEAKASALASALWFQNLKALASASAW